VQLEPPQARHGAQALEGAREPGRPRRLQARRQADGRPCLCLAAAAAAAVVRPRVGQVLGRRSSLVQRAPHGGVAVVALFGVLPRRLRQGGGGGDRVRVRPRRGAVLAGGGARRAGPEPVPGGRAPVGCQRQRERPEPVAAAQVAHVARRHGLEQQVEAREPGGEGGAEAAKAQRRGGRRQRAGAARVGRRRRKGGQARDGAVAQRGRLVVVCAAAAPPPPPRCPAAVVRAVAALEQGARVQRPPGARVRGQAAKVQGAQARQVAPQRHRDARRDEREAAGAAEVVVARAGRRDAAPGQAEAPEAAQARERRLQGPPQGGQLGPAQVERAQARREGRERRVERAPPPPPGAAPAAQVGARGARGGAARGGGGEARRGGGAGHGAGRGGLAGDDDDSHGGRTRSDGGAHGGQQQVAHGREAGGLEAASWPRLRRRLVAQRQEQRAGARAAARVGRLPPRRA